MLKTCKNAIHYKSKIKQCFFGSTQKEFENRLYLAIKEIIPSMTEPLIIHYQDDIDFDIVLEASQYSPSTLYGKFIENGKIQLFCPMNGNNMVCKYILFPNVEIYSFQYHDAEIHNPYSFNITEFHDNQKSYMSTINITVEFNISTNELFNKFSIVEAQTLFNSLKNNSDFNTETFSLLCNTLSKLRDYIHTLTFYKFKLDHVNCFWIGSYHDSLIFDPYQMYFRANNGMEGIFDRKGKLLRIEVKKLQVNLTLQPNETAPTFNQMITIEKDKLLKDAHLLIQDFLPYYQILLQHFFLKKK